MKHTIEQITPTIFFGTIDPIKFERTDLMPNSNCDCIITDSRIFATPRDPNRDDSVEYKITCYERSIDYISVYPEFQKFIAMVSDKIDWKKTLTIRYVFRRYLISQDEKKKVNDFLNEHKKELLDGKINYTVTINENFDHILKVQNEASNAQTKLYNQICGYEEDIPYVIAGLSAGVGVLFGLGFNNLAVGISVGTGLFLGYEGVTKHIPYAGKYLYKYSKLKKLKRNLLKTPQPKATIDLEIQK